VPLDSELARVNSETGKTKAEEIVEFCCEPRTWREVYDFLGLKQGWWARQGYIYPLLENGMLKLATDTPLSSHRVMFIRADMNAVTPMPTNEAVIEYCRFPRTFGDVSKRFAINLYETKKRINALISDGLLIKHNPQKSGREWLRFIGAADNIYTAILKHCSTPKTAGDIREKFELTKEMVTEYKNSLIESGKLKAVNPTAGVSSFQKYIAIESE
jgi:hypothetical protein